MAFLVDTCAWIDVERGALAAADVGVLTGNEDLYLSPVTLAELRLGAELAPDGSIRQLRLAALARLERKPTLSIDAGTGMVFGSLAAHIRAAGRQHRHRIQDLWLGSQAVQHGLKFLTRNPRDFADIPGLDLRSYRLGSFS
ncbi:MAG TPA: type II toxin-antitoxin system VapC family toxin [Terriglobales bacterium]|nr:type II toxin-antitoxin system VapC family toxin [Terriglobales bacterium]